MRESLAGHRCTTATAHARARVARAWERYLGRRRTDAVRTPIADSWRRSHDAGVDPSGEHLAPVLADADEAAARWDVHPLVGPADR